MKRFIFNNVKKIIPTISQTELIALRSGGVGIDREIFLGKVNINKLKENHIEPMNDNEKKLYNKLDNILPSITKNTIYPNKDISEIINQMKSYLGMIINKEYGGQKISYTAQSKILCKIISHNPSLGHLVMVPNSLGPGELLQHYGTTEQKEKYLPRLAKGELIPCFGLTGPENGSDATGKIDRGIVKKINDKLFIRVNLNKRYITLAPIANLCGIAFYLDDPHSLIDKTKQGITLALVEKNHFGLEQTTFHNPNNAGFPNGTLKGEILIPFENVIGGEDKLGQGWPMLMECLAVGRGISLPTCSNSFSKMSTYSMLLYVKHRNQFKMSIGNMEAVQEKLVEMIYHTWVIESSLKYMTMILDQHKIPSVLTACMKQQTTERTRIIVQHGMDIYAGSAICLGDNNFFTNIYNSVPIGITVEGSNTLTRSLIIFGQGLNKSHPHIYNIFDAIQKENHDLFYYHFQLMLSDVIKNYLSSFSIVSSNDPIKRLQLLTIRFSTLTNFIALLGGKIKSQQIISGYMADILSNIYFSYTLLWYHTQIPQDTKWLRDFCIDKLCGEAEHKINYIIDNYPYQSLRLLLKPFKYRKNNIPSIEKIKYIYQQTQSSPIIQDILKTDLNMKNNIIEKLEKLEKLDPKSDDYKKLYLDIISVGEYQINETISTI